MSPFGEVTLGESLVEPLLLEDVIVCYHLYAAKVGCFHLSAAKVVFLYRYCTTFM